MEEYELNNIKKIINKDGIIVIPTETVYGVGTSVYSDEGIKKLYEVKKRDKNKSISVLVSNYSMIEELTSEISAIEKKIIDNFFPGPLTILLKKGKNVSNELTSNNYIGIRMPNHKLALSIIDKCGPLATTSANISGMESEIKIDNIRNIFGDKVDYYVDGGICKYGIGSTIILVENNKINLIREGSISLDTINNKIE